MSKFKVGDRVRVGIEEPDLMCRPEESSGMAGVITRFFGEGQYDVTLDGSLGGCGSDWGYDESELELIND